MISKYISPSELLNIGRNFFTTKLLLTAVELNLFDKLPSTANKLANDYGWDIEASVIFLDALTGLNILEKAKAEYKIAENLHNALSRNPDESILPMLEHFQHLWDKWSDLGTIVQTGRKNKSFSFGKDKNTLNSFIGAMHVIGKKMAGSIVSDLKPVWAKKLLDIGGASGTYTIEFLNNNPDLHAKLFDLPDVIPMAEKRITRHNLINRVELISGDFYKDEFPENNDLVWISAIIHQNSRKQNQELFTKAFNALNAGGKIWIRDHIMDNARICPKAGAVFAVNMLVATPGGSTYTFEEVKHDLEKAGFINAKIIRQGENMDCVVEAVKYQ